MSHEFYGKYGPGLNTLYKTAHVKDAQAAVADDIRSTIPQCFLDLLTLAQGVDVFQDDYRMNAVLRACEAILEGGAGEQEDGGA